MRDRGSSKNKLSHWFSEIKYSNCAKHLETNPINMCHFWETRESEGDCLLIKITEGIFSKEIIPETTIDNFEGAAEVVSEEEGNMVSMVALSNLDGLLSKGRSTAMFPSLLSTTNDKTIPANLTVLAPLQTKKTIRCAVFFQAQPWS